MKSTLRFIIILAILVLFANCSDAFSSPPQPQQPEKLFDVNINSIQNVNYIGGGFFYYYYSFR